MSVDTDSTLKTGPIIKLFLFFKKSYLFFYIFFWLLICFLNFRVDPSKDMVYDDDTPYEPAEVDVESSDDSYISAKDDDSEESSDSESDEENMDE